MSRLRSPFARTMRNIGIALSMLGSGALAVAQPGAPLERPDTTYAYLPKLTIDGGDERMEAAINAASLLLTYAQEPLDSVGVLFARAKADRQRITRALNALGYFAPQARIAIADGNIDDIAFEDALADTPPADKIPVDIAVAPGPLFTFGRVALVAAVGSSDEALATLPNDVAGLIDGGPARSADVAAANERIVAALRETGYPLAAVVGREAIADHKTAQLEVTFKVDPGPKSAFGTVAIKGAQNMDPDFLIGLAPFEPGEPFRAATLEDYRAELDRLLVFDNVAIEEAKSLDAQGRLPVTLVVSERKLHVVGVSASWSTLEGAALGGYWTHRNLWGHAEQLRLEAQSSRLLSNGADDYEYAFSTALTMPAFADKRDDLILTASAKRERPDAFDRDAIVLDARVRRRFGKFLRGEAGIAFTQSRETDGLGTRDRSTIQVPVTISYDTRDNILDPTHGLRLNAGVQPILNLTSGSGAAGRVDAAVATYWQLDDRGDHILAGRLALGASVADDVTDLPVDLRFFSGGGGSVRGYEYQALSPRNAINQIVGGRSLAEGSVELRSWLWDDIGVAAFVDAGSASSSNVPDLEDIGVGVGVGARYRTPVGPVRLDIAVPLDPPLGDPKFGIYVALGQAF